MANPETSQWIRIHIWPSAPALCRDKGLCTNNRIAYKPIPSIPCPWSQLTITTIFFWCWLSHSHRDISIQFKHKSKPLFVKLLLHTHTMYRVYSGRIKVPIMPSLFAQRITTIFTRTTFSLQKKTEKNAKQMLKNDWSSFNVISLDSDCGIDFKRIQRSNSHTPIFHFFGCPKTPLTRSRAVANTVDK